MHERDSPYECLLRKTKKHSKGVSGEDNSRIVRAIEKKRNETTARKARKREMKPREQAIRSRKSLYQPTPRVYHRVEQVRSIERSTAM